MQAINDYVIVREVKAKEEKVGSIIVSNPLVPDYLTANVISVGNDAKYLEGGEDVMFLKQNSKELSCNGEQFRAIRAENIILKL